MGINLEQLQKSTQGILPPRIALYGPEGIGKSTFADLAPNPIFGRTEKDRGKLISPRHFCSTYDEVIELVSFLLKEPHDFLTFNLDTIDWLEPLVHKKACEVNNWANIEQPGYGKGYLAAMDLWRDLLEGLDALGVERGMTVIVICHAKAKAYKNPETEAYDRYNLKVRDDTSALIREWADAVFFINYKVMIAKEKEGFGQERKRGVGMDQRIIYTSERPAAIAKNRYNLPDQIVFDKDGKYWGIIAEHIPFLTAMTQQPEQTKPTKTE